MGAGVCGISVHMRPCVGLFRGRCVNGVMCVCADVGTLKGDGKVVVFGVDARG